MLSNVTLSLSNPEQLSVSLDQVIKYQDRTTSDCRSAIRRIQSAGMPITMVNAVLRADVNYNIKFDAALDARARDKLLNEVADSLGGKYDSQSSGVIQGTGLFWGFRESSEAEIIGPTELVGAKSVSIVDLPRALRSLQDSISIVVTDTSLGRRGSTALHTGTTTPIQIQMGEGLIPRDKPFRTTPIAGRN
jgi:hypothetical protein